MQKIIFLALIVGFLIVSIYTNSIYYNTNYKDNYSTYTYLNNSEITDCGSFNISTNYNLINFGECLTLDKKLDINKIIQDYNLKVVSIEEIENYGLILYTCYYFDLPKYRILNNSKFNIQIAVVGNTTKIGYPAIFDSF